MVNNVIGAMDVEAYFSGEMIIKKQPSNLYGSENEYNWYQTYQHELFEETVNPLTGKFCTPQRFACSMVTDPKCIASHVCLLTRWPNTSNH